MVRPVRTVFFDGFSIRWTRGGGTTDEAFVLILHVCLSPPDSNSNDSIPGGGGEGAKDVALGTGSRAPPPPGALPRSAAAFPSSAPPRASSRRG